MDIPFSLLEIELAVLASANESLPEVRFLFRHIHTMLAQCDGVGGVFVVWACQLYLLHMSDKKFYITSSLPYVNGEPHIGFAMEIIQTDVLARYHRQRGYDTHFLTGTDEHGAKLAQTATKQNQTPQEICDTNSAKFQALRQTLNLSWDDFIRTTDRQRHWPAAQQLWSQLVAAGKLEKRKYKGLYCTGCEEFKRTTDLTDGKCPHHQTTPQEVEEENWFFRLSDYSDQILELLEKREVAIVPEFRAKEILNVIKDGLHDVSFSRPSQSLTWGIPVPDDDTQTMYVWCDALTNYISAIGYAKESADFKKWWPADCHVIGKDIVRFHAGIWLGMLLAAGLELPKRIYVHGFITAEGQKMGKSLGNVVDPAEITKEWGTDALRYYLLSEIPSGQDGDFSKERFQEKYNAELANELGNLVSRVIAMALKLETQPSPRAAGLRRASLRLQDTDIAGQTEVEKMWQGVGVAMADYDFRRTLAAIWQLIDWANKYVDTQKPWELKDDLEKQKKILATLLEAIRHVALALQPYLPETAERIAAALGVNLEGDFKKLQAWGAVSEFQLSKPGILFPKQD